MTFSAKYLGSSGWIIRFRNINVLIDPWIKGNLFFSPGPWLFEGRLTNELEVPKEINLILLTQGLADHCHIPSLRILNKAIPVISSLSASRVVRKLGFQSVIALKPGQESNFKGLKIHATEGASVPSLENGYILKHEVGSLYLEPHGFLDQNISSQQLDAVITPVVNLGILLLGDFIKGKNILPDLIKRFKPLTLLSSTISEDAIYSGLINNFIRKDLLDMQWIRHSYNQLTFIDSQPGQTYYLDTYKD